MRPAEVISDATLLHALLQAVLDWSLEHARQSVEYRIEIRSWPANARLICRFPHHHVSSALPGDVLAAEDDASSALDTLAWRLVQQLARTLDLMVERQDESERAMLAIEFPRTVSDQQLEGVAIGADRAGAEVTLTDQVLTEVAMESWTERGTLR